MLSVRCLVSISMMLLVLVRAAVSYRKPCQGGEISKQDSFFLLGQDVTLNCTVTDPNIKAMKLFFRRGITNERVTKKYINKLSPTSIQMVIPNATEEDLILYRKAMKYKCYAKVKKGKPAVCIASTYVFLECNNREASKIIITETNQCHYPVKVKDFKGVFYNFEQLNFTWALGVEYRNMSKEVIVEARYGTVVDLDNIDKEWNDLKPCHIQTRTTCVVLGYNNKFNIQLQVRVTNTLQNVSATAAFTMDTFDILEPEAMHDLIIKDSSARCVEISLFNPGLRDYVKNITYWSECDDGKTVVYGNKSIICDLVPYNNYSFSISQRLLHNGQECGHWSRPVTKRHQTLSDAPDVSPEESSLLFEIQGNTTLIVWRPLRGCALHGPIQYIQYRVTVDGKLIDDKRPDLLLQIKSPIGRPTLVSINAGNNKGWSKQWSDLTIYPQALAPVPPTLIIQYNISDNCRQTFADVIPSADDSFTNISLRLVTCEGKAFCKKSSIKIIPLIDGQLSYVFPIDDCYSDDTRYGIITEGRKQGEGHLISSGIHWVDCAYAIDKVPVDPVKMYPSQATNGGIQVNWQQYDCQTQDAGYIEAYIVSYCEDKQTDCQCDKTEHYVDRSRNRYIISGLDVHGKLCVWVRGKTAAGSGPSSQPHSIVIQPDTSKTLHVVIIVIIAVSLGLGLVIYLVGCKFVPYCLRELEKKRAIRLPELHLHNQEQDDGTSLQMNGNNPGEDYQTYHRSSKIILDGVRSNGTIEIGPHGYQDIRGLDGAIDSAYSTKSSADSSVKSYSILPLTNEDNSHNKMDIQLNSFNGDCRYIHHPCLDSLEMNEQITADLHHSNDTNENRNPSTSSTASLSDELRVITESYVIAAIDKERSNSSNSLETHETESSVQVNFKESDVNLDFENNSEDGPFLNTRCVRENIPQQSVT